MVYEKNPLIFFGESFGFFRLCFGKKESAVSIWVMSLTMFLGRCESFWEMSLKMFLGRCEFFFLRRCFLGDGKTRTCALLATSARTNLGDTRVCVWRRSKDPSRPEKTFARTDLEDVHKAIFSSSRSVLFFSLEGKAFAFFFLGWGRCSFCD